MNTDEEQKNIVLAARMFANERIKPFANEFDRNQLLPSELIETMSKKGFMAASLPKKYGGLELDPINYGLFTEEIGKSCSNVRGLITVHTSLVGETILKWGTEEQKDKWLPKMCIGEKFGAFGLTEPNIGTDARNIQTCYRKEGKKFIINGKKKWISFGDFADFFIIVAKNNNDVSTFIVERCFEGVTTIPIKGLLACRASYIAEIELTNVEVPEENLLSKEGNGFSFVVNTALDHGRYSIAWAGVAIAQAALDAMVSYARERSQFGKKIYNFQLIQKMIADAVTKTQAARRLCLNAAELRKKNDNAAIMETIIAKYFSSQISMGITIDAVQLHGGNGCCDNYPVERLFREAKVLEIIEGTSQVLQEIISRYGLKKYYYINAND